MCDVHEWHSAHFAVVTNVCSLLAGPTPWKALSRSFCSPFPRPPTVCCPVSAALSSRASLIISLVGVSSCRSSSWSLGRGMLKRSLSPAFTLALPVRTMHLLSFCKTFGSVACKKVSYNFGKASCKELAASDWPKHEHDERVSGHGGQRICIQQHYQGLVPKTSGTEEKVTEKKQPEWPRGLLNETGTHQCQSSGCVTCLSCGTTQHQPCPKRQLGPHPIGTRTVA